MEFETYAKQWHKNASQLRLRILKAIAICEHIHQMMMRTSEKDMANSVDFAGIDTFINNAAGAIHKTYHKNITRPHQAQQEHSNKTQSLVHRS
jgi:hypothetical protein